MSTSEGVRIVEIDAAGRDEFLAYAREHGPAHDDSYLAPEDVATFDPAAEPSALALDGSDTVVGAASVMLAGYETEGRGRFRILHAADEATYGPLLDYIRGRLPASISRVGLFLPAHAGPVEDALVAVGFAETRRAYLLEHRGLQAVPEIAPPSGTVFVRATPSVAEDVVHVINRVFHGEPGHYDMTAARAAEILGRERVIEEGTLLALRGGVPAGLVITVADAEDPFEAEIETLGVLPAHQGVGLGRALLHAALRAASAHRKLCAVLSVAAANERALALYLDTGFRVGDVRVCWEADVSGTDPGRASVDESASVDETAESEVAGG
ncbi:MAG TPA: GNAT family N-acetyltransferase [Coriobacteriia bacterium]|nr:GNAT family N-acetyltransferase [Coriobacteriia bacterium]